MNKQVFLFFAVAILWQAACTNSGHVSPGKSFKKLAWNEDTVNACYFVLINDKKFSYTFITKEKEQQSQMVYTGDYTYSQDENEGKIFLKYKNGIQPPGIANYLIIENLGNYFIQPFTNGRKRMYLRIQFPRRWRY